jgi:hypothetical protein
VGNGGISWLALCAVLAAIILVSLRLTSGTGPPSIALLPLVALKDVAPRAGPGFAGTRFGGGGSEAGSGGRSTHDR